MNTPPAGGGCFKTPRKKRGEGENMDIVDTTGLPQQSDITTGHTEGNEKIPEISQIDNVLYGKDPEHSRFDNVSERKPDAVDGQAQG
jgi:hypothetical protein